MLSRLRLKNFKGWFDTGDLRLAPITAFFGTNSSGKTSLLQSILLLKQTAATTDRSRVLFPGDPRSLVDLGTIADLVHGHKLDTTLEFSLSWSLPEEKDIDDSRVSEISFTTQIGMEPDGQPYVQEATYSFGNVTVALDRTKPNEYRLLRDGQPMKRRTGRAWPLPSPVRFYGFPDEVANYYQDAAWVSDLALELERELARIHYVGPLREYPRRWYLWAGERPENVGIRGDLAIPALLAARGEGREVGRGLGRGRRYFPFEKVIAEWLERMGLIESFRVEPVAKNRKDYEVKVKRTKTSAEVFITDVGFGVSQVLPVLVESYYALPNETVIFEQPEIHLHPRVQADLADVVVEAAKNCDVQFLIESHSEHFLRRLQRRVAEGGISPQEVALYFCTVAEERLKVETLELDLLGNITNWPKDFFGDEMADRAAMLQARRNR